MRVWLTGGTGFIGSNIVHSAIERGDDVLTTVHSSAPPDDARYRTEQVDMVDADAVRRSMAGFDPDVVVHCAILNDWDVMYADRHRAWDAYVEATRATADAAADAGAPYVLVSTDWVYDGTQHGADEETPPNPVNLYGVLKMASEIAAIERGGAVARVSGVNGLHRAQAQTPRNQDPGFGYFVLSIVESLSRDIPFSVWESDDINMIATPSLASECAEIILEVGRRGLDGVFHCSGADPVSRMELALVACDVFDLDPTLLRSTAPPESAFAGFRIPYDTSLTTPRTDALLDRRATPLRTLLEAFRDEYERAAA